VSQIRVRSQCWEELPACVHGLPTLCPTDSAERKARMDCQSWNAEQSVEKMTWKFSAHTRSQACLQ
jgi:glutathione S-transferase